MERRRRPATLARLAGVALLAVAATTSCGGSGPAGVGAPVAATVNGHDIEVSEVRDLLQARKRYTETQASNKDQQTAANGKVQLEELLGDGDGTFSAEAAANTLTQLISYQIVVQELARKGEKVGKDDLATARTSVEESVGGAAELAKIDDHLVDVTIRSNAAFNVFKDMVAKSVPTTTSTTAPAPTEADLRALYEQTKDANPLCLSLIASADEAGARAAKARIDAGDDFGTVAKEVSTDPQSAQQDGYAGCATLEQAQQAFALDLGDAEPGEVRGPIESQGQFLVIRVESTTGETFEQARPRLEQQLAASQQPPADAGAEAEAAASARFEELLKDADVEVSSRYGRWDAKTAAVIPPKVEGTTTTTIPTVQTAPVEGPAETAPAETVPAETAPSGSAPADTSTTVPG